MDEINIMKSLDHPNIIKYIDFFKEPDVFYLCLEYAPGGELFERIVLREQYSEDIARLCVRNICLGLKHCHDHNVVHRYVVWEMNHGGGVKVISLLVCLFVCLFVCMYIYLYCVRVCTTETSSRRIFC